MSEVFRQTLSIPGTNIKWDVVVFQNLRSMRKYSRTRDALAACSAMQGPVWGEMVFSRTRLYWEFITHEACHMAYNIARRPSGLDNWASRINNCEEERICYPIGAVMEQTAVALAQARIQVLGRVNARY